MSGKKDLFTTLLRWAHRQGENYTSEAFVWLIGHLLQNEPPAGRALVEWICFGTSNEMEIGETVAVSTQTRTGHGTPDIRIESDMLVALVEVKTWSTIGDTQIERYRRVLNELSDSRQTQLVLLTHYPPPSFAEGSAEPDVRLRWHEVANKLRMLSVESEVTRFLIMEFVQFLERSVMTVEHVGWELVRGTTSMRRLINMLAIAMEHAQIPQYKRTAGWNWLGYYVGNDARAWAGLRYSDPRYVVFGIDVSSVKPERVKDIWSGQWHDEKPENRLDLSSEDIHFFARTKDSQLQRLSEFVRTGFERVGECLDQLDA